MVKSGMSRIMRNDVADGAVGSEGGRSPSALSTGHNGAARGYVKPSPGKVDTGYDLRGRCDLFHFDRRAVSDRGMQAPAIVEGLDKAEDRPLCVLACFEHDVVAQFGLHAAEEALHGCIVPAITFPTHGAEHAVLVQQAAISVCGILAAPVGVMHQART